MLIWSRLRLVGAIGWVAVCLLAHGKAPAATGANGSILIRLGGNLLDQFGERVCVHDGRVGEAVGDRAADAPLVMVNADSVTIRPDLDPLCFQGFNPFRRLNGGPELGHARLLAFDIDNEPRGLDQRHNNIRPLQCFFDLAEPGIQLRSLRAVGGAFFGGGSELALPNPDLLSCSPTLARCGEGGRLACCGSCHACSPVVKERCVAARNVRARTHILPRPFSPLRELYLTSLRNKGLARTRRRPRKDFSGTPCFAAQEFSLTSKLVRNRLCAHHPNIAAILLAVCLFGCNEKEKIGDAAQLVRAESVNIDVRAQEVQRAAQEIKQEVAATQPDLEAINESADYIMGRVGEIRASAGRTSRAAGSIENNLEGVQNKPGFFGNLWTFIKWGIIIGGGLAAWSFLERAGILPIIKKLFAWVPAMIPSPIQNRAELAVKAVDPSATDVEATHLVAAMRASDPLFNAAFERQKALREQEKAVRVLAQTQEVLPNA